MTSPVNKSGKKSCDIQAHGELTRNAPCLNIDVVMLSEKKKRSCPFWSAKRRGKKEKGGFHKDWSAKLAERDKGSFYYQDEWLQDENNEASEQKPINASLSKIPLQETVENLGERH